MTVGELKGRLAEFADDSDEIVVVDPYGNTAEIDGVRLTDGIPSIEVELEFYD